MTDETDETGRTGEGDTTGGSDGTGRGGRSGEAAEAALVERDVDRHPGAHRATEPDEEQVLRELYGRPDAAGIYRGDGEGD